MININNALCDFLDYGHSIYPKERMEFVREKYGDKVAAQVDQLVQETEKLIKESPQMSINEILNSKKQELINKNPQLEENGLNCLIWAFSYWYK